MQKLHCLIYHSVLSKADPLRPGVLTKDTFETQLKILKKWFHVMPLVEGYHRLLEGSLPARAVCITFDDGYQDNVEVALPLLKAYELPATFFVATGFLQGGLMFNDIIIESLRRHNQSLSFEGKQYDCEQLSGKLAAINHITKTTKVMSLQDRAQVLRGLFATDWVLPKLMMNKVGVQTLSQAGMTIGAHTVDHPLLSQETDLVAMAQMIDSKTTLEAILQKQVSWFAYPNGKRGVDYLDKHAQMVQRAGFTAALSTHWGNISQRSNPYHLPRFTPWQSAPKKFTIRMFTHRLSRMY